MLFLAKGMHYLLLHAVAPKQQDVKSHQLRQGEVCTSHKEESCIKHESCKLRPGHFA